MTKKLEGAGQMKHKSRICTMTLLDPQKNEVQAKAGLNWGFSKGHVCPNDSYITIRIAHCRQFPELFPERILLPVKTRRYETKMITAIWDDGTSMDCSLEGTQSDSLTGKIYPKQLASISDKSIMGDYFRKRLGVAYGKRITKADLLRYGRTDVAVSLTDDGKYYIDFSV